MAVFAQFRREKVFFAHYVPSVRHICQYTGTVLPDSEVITDVHPHFDLTGSYLSNLDSKACHLVTFILP